MSGRSATESSRRAAALANPRLIRDQVRQEVLALLQGQPDGRSVPPEAGGSQSNPEQSSGSSPGGQSARGRRQLVTEADVAAARAGGRKLYLARSAIVTPLARDAADRYGVELIVGDPPGKTSAAGTAMPSPAKQGGSGAGGAGMARASSAPATARPAQSPAMPAAATRRAHMSASPAATAGGVAVAGMSASPAPTSGGSRGASRRGVNPRAPQRAGAPAAAATSGLAAGCDHPTPTMVAVGSDHAGFELKSVVRRHLESRGFQVVDFGTDDGKTSVDYPDFVIPAAAAVARGAACRAIVCDCHGNASAMTANKVPGVRAAASRSLEEVESSREHNDINVLCLGQKVLSAAEACAITDRFLAVAFGGDRHARRIGKVMAVERAFCQTGATS